MASKRILIVDDEENIGRSLRMILEREGYQVNFCRSVAEFTKHPDAGRADAQRGGAQPSMSGRGGHGHRSLDTPERPLGGPPIPASADPRLVPSTVIPASAPA